MKSEYAPHTKCPECGLLFTPEAHDDLIKELRLKLQHDQVMEWCKAKLNDYVISLEKDNNKLRKALTDIIQAENGYIGNDYRLAKIARNALGLEDHIKELF